MFKNYFKTAFRSLWKNKTSSLINVFGLTIGLSCCLLIGLYIQHELTYDDFEVNANKIVRVIMEYKFDGGDDLKKGNYTSVRVAPVFKQNFPEITNAVRMIKYQKLVQYNDKTINESAFMYADSSFFNIFSFKLLQGNQQAPLTGSNQVILTASTAKRYFGNENPIGKILMVGTDSSLYTVSGVMQDCPSNSQIKFDFLASFSSLKTSGSEKSYWNANYTTYLLLRQKSDIVSLQAKIAPFMKKEMAGQGATVDFLLEPMKSIHLHSQFEGFEPNNNIVYIYILEAVAVMIMIIACFTYVNLNTARSIERAKEVGVRKVIGADNKQLFWQFIGESILLCSLATFLSILLSVLLLPYFNQLTEKQLLAGTFFSPQFIGALLVLTLLVSFLAGSYPALIISNFQPVRVLKGAFKNTGQGQWVRKSLIVFQFSISIILIVSTFIMQRQLNYIQNKDLGYNRDQVVILPMDWKMASKIDLIKNQIKANSNILSASACYDSPVEIGGGYNMRSSTMPENQQVAVTADPVDQDFIKTTGLKLIAGKNITQQDIKDADNNDQSKVVYHFILNESAARQLGWTPEQAIGKKMFMDASRPGYVKGVVKDFNFESLHSTIQPLVLFSQIQGRNLLVKLRGKNIPQTLSFLQAEWKDVAPYRPFEYHFMDDDFNKLYSSDVRLGKVLNIFAAVAIALACLGLLGLSSYSAKQRIKEIGIRKVLGASIANIATTLSISFVKLIVVAIVISMPLAWWIMDKWMQNFAYKAAMSWWIFLLSGLTALSIAMVTISFQAIKSAVMSPVKSLKME